MVARITTAQVRAERLDDAVRIMREVIQPAAASHDGFLRMEVLVDRETGIASVISYWKDKESLAQSETSGYLNNAHAALVGHLSEPPSFQTFEVVE